MAALWPVNQGTTPGPLGEPSTSVTVSRARGPYAMLVPWCFSAVHLVSCQLSTTQNTEHKVLFLFSRTRDPLAKHNSTLHVMVCRDKS